jgi:hypothetical protein
MQSHMLAGSHLGHLVDIVVGDHTDHRIASGDRVVGPEYHR